MPLVPAAPDQQVDAVEDALETDLAVPGGSVFVLLGPNGAGKTTLIRMLATLTVPDGGAASVDGFDVVRQRSEVRRRISLTGQFAAVDELATGYENLYLMARLSGLRGSLARVRAGELLDAFDLAQAASRRVSTYSAGMRRRLDHDFDRWQIWCGDDRGERPPGHDRRHNRPLPCDGHRSRDLPVRARGGWRPSQRTLGAAGRPCRSGGGLSLARVTPRRAAPDCWRRQSPSRCSRLDAVRRDQLPV